MLSRMNPTRYSSFFLVLSFLLLACLARQAGALTEQDIPEGFAEKEYDRLKTYPSTVELMMQAMRQKDLFEVTDDPDEAIEESGTIAVRSADSLIYDDETDFIYGRARTAIKYNEY